MPQERGERRERAEKGVGGSESSGKSRACHLLMAQEEGGSRSARDWSIPPNPDTHHNPSPYVVHKGSSRKAGGGEKELRK